MNMQNKVSFTPPPVAKTNKGFTLAEVLITLVVIGIIAAITVPLIMANHKRVEYASKIKKFYSNMNNAIKQAEIEQGLPIYLWEFDDFHDLLDNYLGKYLNYIKIEDSSTCMPGCTNVYLSDGTRFGFDCMGSSTLLTANNASDICVIYDVNGEKGPNEWGRDFFQFGIWNEYAVKKYNITSPLSHDLYATCGNYGGSEDCSREGIIAAKNNSAAGLGVSAYLLMLDGWEFKDDYPWRL